MIDVPAVAIRRTIQLDPSAVRCRRVDGRDGSRRFESMEAMMTGQTSARIGLPVMLAFVVAFGVILATNSGRYQVSPPTRTVEAGIGHVGAPRTIRQSVLETARRDELHEEGIEGNRVAPRESRRRRDVENRGDSDGQGSGTVVADIRKRPVPLPEVAPSKKRDENPPRPKPFEVGRTHRGESKTRTPKVESPQPTVDPPEVKKQTQKPKRKADPPTRKVEPPKPKVIPTKPKAPAPKIPKPRREIDELEILQKRLERQLRTVRSQRQSPSETQRSKSTKVVAGVGEYVIRPSDHLGKICQAVYGTAAPGVVQALYEANRDRLKNKNHVMVGQRLRIPPRPGTRVERTSIPASVARGPGRPESRKVLIRLPEPKEPKAASALRRELARKVTPAPKPKRKTEKKSKKRTPTKTKQRYRWYRVRRNDSLSKIAKKTLGNGRRWNELWKLNKGRLRQPNRLPAGTRIKVPLVSSSRGTPALIPLASRALLEVL